MKICCCIFTYAHTVQYDLANITPQHYPRQDHQILTFVWKKDIFVHRLCIAASNDLCSVLCLSYLPVVRHSGTRKRNINFPLPFGVLQHLYTWLDSLLVKKSSHSYSKGKFSPGSNLDIGTNNSRREILLIFQSVVHSDLTCYVLNLLSHSGYLLSICTLWAQLCGS